jgi:hypothetical protein
LHVKQRLTKTPRQQKKTKTKRLELHHAQQSSTHLIQSTTPRPTSNEKFAWFGGAAWPHHVNAMGHEATSLLQQAADATRTRAFVQESLQKI